MAAQPERFRGEIHPVADSAGFEMHVAIATGAMDAGGGLEIPNHRKGHAGVTGEILAEAKAGHDHALVAQL